MGTITKSILCQIGVNTGLSSVSSYPGLLVSSDAPTDALRRYGFDFDDLDLEHVSLRKRKHD